MPQRQSLFADLGRPTKRGIRKCPKCGTVNGTRGNSCKNKSCDVVFRDNGASKKSSTEACKVSIHIPGLQIFSVRLRDRGPDYRNFVQLQTTSSREGSDSNEAVELQSPAKCYVDACVKSKEFPCSHIQAAQRCFSESQPLKVKHSTLNSLNVPSEYQQTLSAYINEGNDTVVQRVSKTSFIVKCVVTSKHPLGFLHIMFLKHNRGDGNMEKKFLCTCKTLKPQNRDNESSQANSTEGAELATKFCFHYHACLCAFASEEKLSSEFNYFLSQNHHESAPTLLSQLHLVTIPTTGASAAVDGMDANHISVEIMQENISLLESITAEDATLHNVQSLEGVLSDQIIVTNVDDSLSFGDAPVLDALDDGDSQRWALDQLAEKWQNQGSQKIKALFDLPNNRLRRCIIGGTREDARAITHIATGHSQGKVLYEDIVREMKLNVLVRFAKEAAIQLTHPLMKSLISFPSEHKDNKVCQIFASAHNTIQLTNPFSNAENVQTVNVTSVLPSPTGGKKRRQVSADDSTDGTVTHTLQPLVNTNHYENISKSKGGVSKGIQSSTITFTTSPVSGITSTAHTSQAIPIVQENQNVDAFDLWLSGVNERMNATMNYQFSGKPDPIVYYISSEFFDKLKERITAGVKKKRLPNQSVIITRTDRPPAGTFTKHVWKITNIIHVLQIFHNHIIPLKISQYFMKGPNGVFEEWVPPNEPDRRNQFIKPHVHSTYLRVGKSDPNTVESVPFVIEWIPDILLQSKLGELSLIFEFTHSEPRDNA